MLLLLSFLVLAHLVILLSAYWTVFPQIAMELVSIEIYG